MRGIYEQYLLHAGEGGQRDRGTVDGRYLLREKEN